MKITKPYPTLSSIHNSTPQLIIDFLNTNSKSFGSINYLGAFIDNYKIKSEFGIKAITKFIIVEREEYSEENPGESYTKNENGNKDIFAFNYDLPYNFITSDTEIQKFILNHSVETHSCNPKSKCSRCNGSGHCKSCDARGYNSCSSCSGTGKKEQRDGSFANGKPKYKKVACSGCHGSGRKSCTSCSGSKKCSTCGGDGIVTCIRCAGSSRFQTYLGYSSRLKLVNTTTFLSKNNVFDAIIPNTLNKITYDDNLIEWSNNKSILFDNRNVVLNLNENAKDIVSVIDKIGNSNVNSKIGRVHLSFENVPITIVEYQFEGKDYKINIVGENNIVCFDNIPKKHSHKSSFIIRLKNLFTKKKRQIAFLYIASFIFNADDTISDDEMKLFETIINKINIKPDFKNSLIQNLKEKKFLDDIYPLIKVVEKDRRALIFAWHCVIQDVQINEKEVLAFNDLCKKFNLNDEEIENIKNKAKQFSSLSDIQMLEEYFR